MRCLLSMETSALLQPCVLPITPPPKKKPADQKVSRTDIDSSLEKARRLDGSINQ